MKRMIFITILFLISSASAQQTKAPIQQKIEAAIGSLMVENASLNIKIEELQQKIKELEDKEKQNVGQNPK